MQNGYLHIQICTIIHFQELFNRGNSLLRRIRLAVDNRKEVYFISFDGYLSKNLLIKLILIRVRTISLVLNDIKIIKKLNFEMFILATAIFPEEVWDVEIDG